MSINITDIIEAINQNRIRITDHADEEAQADQLRYDEIIENYPKDKPYPSCLIYGQTATGEPIHSVWAYNEEKGWGVLITVYRPDPNLWINFRKRKKRS